MAISPQLFLLLLLMYTKDGVNAQGLTVSIVSSPDSEPFPAADWIKLSCHVTGNTSMVTYNWTFLCGSQDPPLVVNTHVNRTNVGQFDVSIRSTSHICQDTAMCHAADQSGNTGHATWRIGRVTGAGLWGSTNFIHNTSAFRANANGNIGSIYCHSTSNSSNVGEWISPDGLDITNNFTDPFNIQFNNGPGYPSYNTFQLQSPSSQPFTSAYEGVYSCIVPDDLGVLQTLHIGIYTHAYSEYLALFLNELGRFSESPLVLHCPTTGLPPTNVVWGKGVDLLDNGATYGTTTQLRDRKNSTFDNFLLIRQTMQQAEGLYFFFAANAIDGTVQDKVNGANTSSTYLFMAMYTVGRATEITCTLSGAIYYIWTDAYGNTILDGRQITFQANDSIHHNIFACYGITQTSEIKYFYLKFITNVPSSILQVTASSDDSTPILGQSYSIDCVGHKTSTGLINSPSPQWFDSSGSLLSTNSDVQLQGPRNVGLTSSELVAHFPTLLSSHAGNYTCRVSLSSPARAAPIVKTTSFGITVQIPAPTVQLTVFSSEPHAVGGTLTIHCEAVVSNHVNTPVSVDFTWGRTSGSLTAGSDSRVNISETTTVRSHTYLSILILSDLGIGSDSNQNYWCQASVRSSPPSQYILDSTTATSTDNYHLTVNAIGVTVSVTPAQLTVINAPPSNSFTLTCTATSATNTSAEIVFAWSKQVLGSSSSTQLTDNGGSVVIVTSGNTSTLTTSETQSGGYVYNCSARIGDAEASSDTAIVSVRGPTVPVVASSIESTVTSFSTVTIAWSVSSVSYTPETYAVVYGTSQSNLVQRSSTVSSVSGTTDYSVELANLQDSTLYYFKVESNNSVGSTESDIQTFEVQNASVIISITSNVRSPLAGGVINLTCSIVELVDHSGDTVVTWRGPDGQSISSGDDFTITRQATSQRVVYSLQFNPLRVSHQGQYTCEASIQSVGYFDSKSFSLSVTPVTLAVTIQSTGTNQVGTSRQLACQIDTTQTASIGQVVYEWTSTCSGECFVLRQSGVATVSTEYLKAVDAGTHTCTVTDRVGNRGNATVMISTTGVALYHSSNGLLSNNSVLIARDGFLQGSLFCLSGRQESGIGRWISPGGNDYTLPGGTHPFDVSVGSESNPGLVEITVSGSESRFPAGIWDGVYSCVISDETGIEQTLYLGINIVFGSPPVPVVQPLAASTMNIYPFFTINCSSSASAATEVVWTKDSQLLNIDSRMYGTVQILREGTTSSYDNLLIVYGSDMNEHSGEYGCTVTNSFGSTTKTAAFHGIQVSEHGVFSLGSAVSITCSSDFGVQSIDWLHGKEVISTTMGSQGELRIESVSESDHGQQYTCRATTSFGVQEHNITIQVEVDPDSALSVNITSSNTPVEGSAFILTCTAIKSQHLMSTPSVDWYDGGGNRIVTDGGIRVGILLVSGDGTVIRSLTFLSLETTHTMEYRCNATIRFNPHPYITSKQAVWALAVEPIHPIEGPTNSGTGQTEQSGGSSDSVVSPAVYLGAGIGGGLVIVVLFVLVFLVILWLKRSRKLERRQREANEILFNNNCAMAMGMNGSYRMSGGTFHQRVQNPMMLPLSDGPNLPPRNEFYMTPPNAYERSIPQSDSYTCMSSSNTSQKQAPPPQYSDPFYAQIPADNSTKSDDDQPQDEYVIMNDVDKDETSEKVQEVYGN